MYNFKQQHLFERPIQDHYENQRDWSCSNNGLLWEWLIPSTWKALWAPRRQSVFVRSKTANWSPPANSCAASRLCWGQGFRGPSCLPFVPPEGRQTILLIYNINGNALYILVCLDLSFSCICASPLVCTFTSSARYRKVNSASLHGLVLLLNTASVHIWERSVQLILLT